MIDRCAGLATDTIQWTLWKRQLQRAADSAAIAGVYDRETARAARRRRPRPRFATISTLNLHTWMTLQATGHAAASRQLYDTVLSGEHGCFDQPGHGDVLAIQQQLPFSSLFMIDARRSLPRRRRRQAFRPAAAPASQALESSASATGINNSGNTTVNAPTCILYSELAVVELGKRRRQFARDGEGDRGRRRHPAVEQLASFSNIFPIRPPLAGPVCERHAGSERHALHGLLALDARAPIWYAILGTHRIAFRRCRLQPNKTDQRAEQLRTDLHQRRQRRSQGHVQLHRLHDRA